MVQFSYFSVVSGTCCSKSLWHLANLVSKDQLKSALWIHPSFFSGLISNWSYYIESTELHILVVYIFRLIPYYPRSPSEMQFFGTHRRSYRRIDLRNRGGKAKRGGGSSVSVSDPTCSQMKKRWKILGQTLFFLSCCSSLSVSLRVSQGKWCFSHSMIVKWPPRKKRDGLYQGAKSCHFFEDKILFLKAMSFPNTGCFILKGKNSIDGIS